MDLRGRKATNSYQILLKLSNAILSLIKNQAYQAPYIHLFGNYIEVVSIISNTRKIFNLFEICFLNRANISFCRFISV